MAAEKVAQLEMPDAVEYDGLATVRGDMLVSIDDAPWPRMVQKRYACLLYLGSVRAVRFNSHSNLQGRPARAQCGRDLADCPSRCLRHQ